MTHALSELSFAEAVAYNHRNMPRDEFLGLLRQLATVRSSIVSRQGMENVAEELELVGLMTAASDLMEFAQGLPHVWELPHDYAHETQHKDRMAEAKKEWEAKHSKVDSA